MAAKNQLKLNYQEKHIYSQEPCQHTTYLVYVNKVLEIKYIKNFKKFLLEPE